eukprot:scaffold3424_cov256-Pinguiococcus_pyrenoidosus.AAC.13
MEFTEEYPNKAPTVRFLTKMFHPNIYNNGLICLDILQPRRQLRRADPNAPLLGFVQNQWSPIYDVSAILTSIQSLLCDPNPSSPANSEASRLYQENRREYVRRVREIVEESWMDNDEFDDDDEDDDDDEEDDCGDDFDDPEAGEDEEEGTGTDTNEETKAEQG